MAWLTTMINQLESTILGLVVIALLAYVSYKKEVFDKKGSLSGVLISCVILIYGGLNWLTLLIAFTIIGSASTRVGLTTKKMVFSASNSSRKRADRGLKNVLANGIPPLVFVITDALKPGGYWGIAYAASLASATSDTLSTEIGLLSNNKPRRAVRLNQVVEKGVSGGVTLLGLASGAVGALSIGILSALLRVIPLDPRGVLLVTIAGLAGNYLDSVIGDLLQAKYRCVVCGRTTDETTHCGRRTRLSSGHPMINNHVVNFAVNSVAGLMALVLAQEMSVG